MKKVNVKQLLICIFIPVFLGFLVGRITSSSIDYENFILPSFAPPSWVFPVVWTILYILMGISSYLILNSNHFNKSKALLIYITQLAVNLFWSILFFSFNLQLFAFIWILLLIGLVIFMIYNFYKINKVSAVIQLPYLLWLFFAALLNISIYVLN